MAPEQIEGREVTARSDIYALGLVLYEVFTGRRALTATTIEELIRQQTSGDITSPSGVVSTLDPAVERAILRCLDPDPRSRPASAIAVSAALPGGDPLAAALAAGETPSPEMVAAAGDRAREMPLAAALSIGAAVVVLLLICAGLADRATIFGRVPLPKSTEVLADRAGSIREALGYRDTPADRVNGWRYDAALIEWLGDSANRPRWTDASAGRLPVVAFWQRTSSSPFIPFDSTGSINLDDPPTLTPGMVTVETDAQGRLRRFLAVPPRVDAASSTNGSVPAIDWDAILTAAGFDPASVRESPPSRMPPVFADERRAWNATQPGTDLAVRIEAAAWQGMPVALEIIGPWSKPDDALGAAPRWRGIGQTAFVLTLLGAAAALARRNLKSGRADRQGAFRVGALTCLVLIAAWVVGHHVSDVNAERERLFSSIGLALFIGGAMYIVYLALEPFVRRSWPTMLVGWSRVVAGRWRDARVSRDVLLGVGCGALIALSEFAFVLLPPLAGLDEPSLLAPSIRPLVNGRHTAMAILNALNEGLQNGLLVVLEFAIFRAGALLATSRLSGTRTRAERIATAIAFAAVVAFSHLNNDGSGGWLGFLVRTATVTVILVAVLRIGLLGAVFMFFAERLLTDLPLTLDNGRIYATTSWVTLAIVAALACGALAFLRAPAGTMSRPASP
jgi:serine/threonine-protein kinase